MENCENKDCINEIGYINEIKQLDEIKEKIESINIPEIKNRECTISINQIDKIEPQSKKISKSFCKIKIETHCETIFGLGFLLKLYIEQECFYFIVSYEHVIKKDIINDNNIISMYFNNELKSSNLKSDQTKRYIKSFIDIGLDITVIELLKEDNISQDYFLWDENEIDNNGLTNSQIYIPQYEKGKELINIKGNIIKITKYEFIYSTNGENDSSGCPIFLENSIDIFGIVRGNNKDNVEKCGYLISSLVDIIKNDLNKIRHNGKYINGKYIWDDGKYYIGEFKDNIPNGKGIKYYPNGNILYEGDFINGKFEGNGKYYYDNGDYYIGKYKNGLRNGKGIKYYKNGKILFNGEYINGKAEGNGKCFWEDGEYCICHWKNGIRNGRGIEYYSNGNIKYDGEYANDKYEGNGKYIWSNGEYYIGQWKISTINGKGTVYYSDGNIKYEGEWIDGKFNGKGRYNYENGEYYIGNWINNLKHGKGIKYHSNGNIFYDGIWINDKREGNGKCIMSNGNYYIGQWKNDGANGKGIIYYENGKIAYKGDFVNGKFEGIGSYIYENGDYYIGQWKNHFKHGKGTMYNADGKIENEGKWDNDIFVGK